MVRRLRRPDLSEQPVGVADVLPEFHHRERHSVRVDAPPERALAAARSVTPREAPLLQLLFRLRGLGAPGERPIWEQMKARGFGEVAPDTLAAIGRPWRRLDALAPGGSGLSGFEAFSKPGWAKMAMDFRAEDGVLSTETRVLLTDARARRRFRAYWLVVRPFSGLVRRSWLRAAKRRAEAGP